MSYATYFGGTGGTAATLPVGIEVDQAGNACVTADVASYSDIFTSPNAVLDGCGIGGHAWVGCLDPAGAQPIYGTFLTSDVGSAAGAVAIDPVGPPIGAGGLVYVTGRADGPGFPTLNGFQAQHVGASDAFVVVLDPAARVAVGAQGESLLYGTLLGGIEADVGDDIAVGPQGMVVVTGSTLSIVPGLPLFPIRSALQPLPGGARDGFLARLDPFAGGDASLPLSTFVGGEGDDNGLAGDGGSRSITEATSTSASPPGRRTWGRGPRRRQRFRTPRRGAPIPSSPS